MDYEDNGSLGYLIKLSPEETDFMFDPFDPSDVSLPSHLHHAGHRFIKESMYQWMVDNIGEPIVEWRSFKNDYVTGSRTFQFRTANQAMRFKLAWFNLLEFTGP